MAETELDFLLEALVRIEGNSIYMPDLVSVSNCRDIDLIRSRCVDRNLVLLEIHNENKDTYENVCFRYNKFSSGSSRIYKLMQRYRALAGGIDDIVV